jgi:hypothetical protein
VVTWQLNKYNENKTKLEEKAALISTTKFDILTECDFVLNAGDRKTKLSHNDITDVCKFFRYQPVPVGVQQQSFNFISALNELAKLRLSNEISDLRREAYDMYLLINRYFPTYTGYWSSSDPNDSMYDIKLSASEGVIFSRIITYVKKLRRFSLES